MVVVDWKTWPEYSVATPIKRWNLSLHVLNLGCLVIWFEYKFRSVDLKRLCSFCLCPLGMILPFYKEVQSNLLDERPREGELRYLRWQFQVTVRHGENVIAKLSPRLAYQLKTVEQVSSDQPGKIISQPTYGIMEINKTLFYPPK